MSEVLCGLHGVPSFSCHEVRETVTFSHVTDEKIDEESGRGQPVMTPLGGGS